MNNTAAMHKNRLLERLKLDLAALDAARELIRAHERYAAENGLDEPVLCSLINGLDVWVTAPYKAGESSTRDIADAPVYVTEFEGFPISVRYVPDAS